MAIELEKRELRSYELRKRKQRQTVAILTAIVLIVLIGIGIFLVHRLLNKNYNDYEVIYSTPRSDSSSAQYSRYDAGIIRYSRDGAMAMDSAGKQLWNGTFEMNDPIIDVCGKYAVISDRGYKTMQVFNGSGKMTTINVPNAIIKASIANQGVTAVLMDGDGINYITLYDENGDKIVDRRTVADSDGYPLDIALSKDGRKLVTSYVSLNSGTLQSNVTFFNFGGVGENYITKIVGGYDFGQTLVPDVEFINNDMVAAYGTDGFALYSMKQISEVIYEESFSTEIKSVFNSDKYIGFILVNEAEIDRYQVIVYNLEGKRVLDKTMNFDYDMVLLSGGELILYSNLELYIWTINGKEKFYYNFENDISYIMPVNNGDGYILVDNFNIEVIRLKETK